VGKLGDFYFQKNVSKSYVLKMPFK